MHTREEVPRKWTVTSYNLVEPLKEAKQCPAALENALAVQDALTGEPARAAEQS